MFYAFVRFCDNNNNEKCRKRTEKKTIYSKVLEEIWSAALNWTGLNYQIASLCVFGKWRYTPFKFSRNRFHHLCVNFRLLNLFAMRTSSRIRHDAIKMLYAKSNYFQHFYDEWWMMNTNSFNFVSLSLSLHIYRFKLKLLRIWSGWAFDS